MQLFVAFYCRLKNVYFSHLVHLRAIWKFSGQVGMFFYIYITRGTAPISQYSTYKRYYVFAMGP
jgi:hypothetical protein